MNFYQKSAVEIIYADHVGEGLPLPLYKFCNFHFQKNYNPFERAGKPHAYDINLRIPNFLIHLCESECV